MNPGGIFGGSIPSVALQKPARHAGRAAAAGVLAFPRHVGMRLANPAASEAAPAFVRHRLCTIALQVRNDSRGGKSADTSGGKDA